MTKEQRLQNELAAYKEAKRSLLSALDENKSSADKVALWDSVAPWLRSVLEQKIESGTFDIRESQRLLWERTMKSVVGGDWEKMLAALE